MLSRRVAVAVIFSAALGACLEQQERLGAVAHIRVQHAFFHQSIVAADAQHQVRCAGGSRCICAGTSSAVDPSIARSVAVQPALCAMVCEVRADRPQAVTSALRWLRILDLDSYLSRLG